MGRLQAVLRVLAASGPGPARVLEELDHASRTIPGAEFATVGYGEYSPATGAFRYACAGHPPPLVVGPDRAAYLQGGRSQPLAVANAPRPQDEVLVRSGTFLLWYSDGLIEDRTQPLDHGLDRLADVGGRSVAEDPEVWCDAVLKAMTNGRRIRDDIVLICLRLARAETRQQHPLSRRLLTPADLAPTRRELRSWAEDHHLGPRALESLQLACTEAMANALEHAYRGASPAAVDLLVESVESGYVRVRVADSGRWQHDARHRDRGRGLELINRLSESTTLDLSPRGTTVTIVIRTDYSAPNGGRAGTLRHGQGR